MNVGVRDYLNQYINKNGKALKHKQNKESSGQISMKKRSSTRDGLFMEEAQKFDIGEGQMKHI